MSVFRRYHRLMVRPRHGYHRLMVRPRLGYHRLTVRPRLRSSNTPVFSCLEVATFAGAGDSLIRGSHVPSFPGVSGGDNMLLCTFKSSILNFGRYNTKLLNEYISYIAHFLKKFSKLDIKCKKLLI